jgi:hypothetical protein
MKLMSFILLLASALSVAAATGAVRPFDDYRVILDRKPFGAPPDRSGEPERVIPVGESFAAQMVLSGIYELDDGNLRVAVTDKKDNSYFALMVGEKDEVLGIELVDVDYEKEEAVLKKGDEVVVLRMSGTSGTQVLSTTEKQERVKQAEERRMSYAERRRQRMLERQKPVEIPQPKLTGEALERHLQDYQMQVIREGLPPLPVQLTPERDEQLVAEGYLPPVDEEGYEIDPEAEGTDVESNLEEAY